MPPVSSLWRCVWCVRHGARAPAHHVLLQDDLEVAPDFFTYFAAVAPLLDQDSSLLAASAWNDLGQSQYVSDPGINCVKLLAVARRA